MKTAKEFDLLSASFNDYFEVLRADTPALRDEVYRIRYEVYCKELAYENASRFPDRRERDEFDELAHHCLLRHVPTGNFAGCVRLVVKDDLDTGARLPFEKHCWQSLDKEFMEKLRVQGVRYGEISRLAVPAMFRRRKGEEKMPVGDSEDPAYQGGKRHSPHIALGLYLAATSIGLDAGLNGVFAMMEPRLSRHLRRYGIRFQQAGGVMDYHGERAAYYISRERILDGLYPEIQCLLDSIHHDLVTGVQHVKR